MPQLHLYLTEDLANKVHQHADAAGISISRYLAEIVQKEMTSDWPEGYFEAVVGGWKGKPLERPDQGTLETREVLEPIAE